MATVPGAGFCGCCEPPSPRTPAEVWNRPGLSAIRYRIGTFATFREAMTQGISKQAELSGLTTRESDDYANTIIELFAGVGDVLTFYNERIANEIFLRPARERDSILRLVRLIGYRLRPGLAATTMLAFTLDDGASTKIRRGHKVMSVPGQDERPVTFETLEAIVADGRLNALPVFSPPQPFNPFHQGRRRVPVVARPPLTIGDRVILFAASALEEKTVTSLDRLRDAEHLTFTPGVQTAGLWPGTAAAAKVARRLQFFGHNAPDSYQVYDTTEAIPPAKRWRMITAGDAGYELGFGGGWSTYPLDARYDAIKPGARLLVDAGPSADPRYRTAVVSEVDDRPTALGQVPNTAPFMQETVTHAALTQAVRGRPTMCVGTDIHLFARSGVGRVLAGTVTAPAWQPVDSLVATEDVSAVSSSPTTIELVARNEANALMHATWSGAWSAWSPLGAVATSRPATLGLGGGEVLIFARSGFFGLTVRSLAAPAWTTLGGVLTSPPVPVSWGGDRVDVFVRGHDRALWRRSRVSGNWEGWERLDGTLASAPAAASAAANRLDVVATDDAGTLIHRRWTGSEWTSWISLGGKVAGEPAILGTSPDRVDVFVRGIDDQVWHITRNGASWGPWVPRGGVLGSAPSVARFGPLILLVARDREGAAIGSAGNGVFFAPFVRFGGGLGAIPDRRLTRVYEIAGDDIEFREFDYPPGLSGGRLAARLDHAAGLEPPAKGRRIVVEAGAIKHLATVTSSAVFASAPGAPADHLRVDFTPPVEAAVENAVLRGNIVEASHGETHPDEPLGNGDATRAFARYRLRRAPLTYLQQSTAIQGVAELEIRVTGERWTEVPSLFGRGPNDRVYTARQLDTGETDITFGDGRTGARVPTGAANVVARYRTGSGLSGLMKAGQLSIPLDRPVGLTSVSNPFPADGAADAESRDDARSSAPTTVRTFGRAVSLQDFEWLATLSGMVARAHATWVWRKLEKTVHLTVAGPAGARLSREARQTLYAALTSARDPNRPLLLGPLVRVPLLVRARLLCDPALAVNEVLQSAREALLGHFSFSAMPLGAAVHASDVMAALHRARGVQAVDLDLFHLKGHADLTAVERALRAVTTAAVQPHIRIFPARPAPDNPALIDRYARAGFEGPTPPPVLSAEQACIAEPETDVQLTAVGSF
jgi:hypothetical protein